MNYIDFLKSLNDLELEIFVNNRIKELEYDSRLINDCDLIGYNLEYNYDKDIIDNDGEFNINLHCMYNGYIPKGIKVVYGLCYNRGFISNDGKYYYVDDDNYILSFINFMKNYDIENEYELFECILDFLVLYFGDYNKIIYDDNKVSRENMFQMLYKNDIEYYKPLKEHGLSWFRGKGNALCSEYSIVSNNIMNFFGIDGCVIFGNYNSEDKKSSGHAYNLVSYEECSTNKCVDLLIDYCNYVNVLDDNYRVISSSPFIEEISIDDELISQMIDNGKHLVFDDYSLMEFGDRIISIVREDGIREYYIDKNVYLRTINEKNNTFCKKK